MKIDKLIHLVGKENQIVSTMIEQKEFADTNAENYIISLMPFFGLVEENHCDKGQTN